MIIKRAKLSFLPIETCFQMPGSTRCMHMQCFLFNDHIYLLYLKFTCKVEKIYVFNLVIFTEIIMLTYYISDQPDKLGDKTIYCNICVPVESST